MFHKKYFKIGQSVKYKGKFHKIIGIRYTAGGILYKLSDLSDWISEKELKEARL